MTEVDKAAMRWAEAKRQQMLREDSRGELIHEVRRQERMVEDAIFEELQCEQGYRTAQSVEQHIREVRRKGRHDSL